MPWKMSGGEVLSSVMTHTRSKCNARRLRSRGLASNERTFFTTRGGLKDSNVKRCARTSGGPIFDREREFLLWGARRSGEEQESLCL